MAYCLSRRLHQFFARSAVSKRPGGNYDAFVVKSDLTTGPMLSSYLGGSANENSNGNVDYYGTIAMDSSGHIYLAGRTDSADFPTTPNAFDTTFNGPAYDGFLMKISIQ